jgi:type IV secretory pathway TrbD component
MKKLLSRLNVKDPKQVLIYIVVLILAVWLLKKSANTLKVFLSKLRYDLFGAIPQDGSQSQYPGGTGTISENRKAVLQGIAKELRDGITAVLGDADEELAVFNGLNDTEFIYAYESYIAQFNTNPYYDVDWEFMPLTDEDEKFMERAKTLNLPIA